MRRPKRKNWPRSWKQTALIGGTVTFEGRSFEAEYVVLSERVEASTPEQLEAAVVERMTRTPES